MCHTCPLLCRCPACGDDTDTQRLWLLEIDKKKEKNTSPAFKESILALFSAIQISRHLETL